MFRDALAANTPRVWTDPRRMTMATQRQKSAARRNIKKATSAAKSKRTISKLPAKTRSALGKEGAKARARGGTHASM
jgi:hypothetical protein